MKVIKYNNKNIYKHVCLSARRMNEECESSLDRCISKHSTCHQVCTCNYPLVTSHDGRCRLPDHSLVGESCQVSNGVSKMCGDQSSCIEETCSCESPLMERTAEHFWSSPYNEYECTGTENSLCKLCGCLRDSVMN